MLGARAGRPQAHRGREAEHRQPRTGGVDQAGVFERNQRRGCLRWREPDGVRKRRGADVLRIAT